MKKCIFLILLIFSTEFALANNEIVAKKIYPNISKDAIFDAAKMLFYLSNKENENNDFIINAYRDKLEVEKVVFKNKIIAIELLLDKWTIEVREFENESRVLLSLEQSDAVDLDDKKNIEISFHNLFWNRLEYLLGINTNWESCSNFFSNDLASYYCYNSLLSNKPKDDVLSKNILISEKNQNLNTIDNINADIFVDTDLYLKKSGNNIFEQNEDINNTKILVPIMEDTILETKAVKVIEKKEKDKSDEIIDNATIKENEDLENTDESINTFKDNMKDIVNMKNSLNESDIQKIISESNDLKENSEFSLESK